MVLTRILSLVALVIMIGLAALALPNFIKTFTTYGDEPAAIFVTGLVIVILLAGAVMLMLFGVIGTKAPKEQ